MKKKITIGALIGLVSGIIIDTINSVKKFREETNEEADNGTNN